MFQPMSKQEPGKYACHFCKATLKVNHWAFVKNKDGLTQSVPCCERCVKKFYDKEQQNKNAIKILNKLKNMWRTRR